MPCGDCPGGQAMFVADDKIVPAGGGGFMDGGGRGGIWCTDDWFVVPAPATVRRPSLPVPTEPLSGTPGAGSAELTSGGGVPVAAGTVASPTGGAVVTGAEAIGVRTGPRAVFGCGEQPASRTSVPTAANPTPTADRAPDTGERNFSPGLGRVM